MKKLVTFLIALFLALPVFSQGTVRLPTIGVMPFETLGTGLSQSDAAELTRLLINELAAWEIMTVMSGEQALNAEYIVQGTISREQNQIVLRATTTLRSTGRALNSSRENAASMAELPIEAFCIQIAEHVPFPNFMLGKWRASVEVPDGPLICIIVFRSDRSIVVERYDTWEHNGSYSLRYQAIGDGNYSYAPYRRRNVNIGGSIVQADATVSINLNLEDALPNFVSVDQGGLRVQFDGARNNFELFGGGLPCGNNFTGPSVHPSANLFFTRFTKIQ
jgi:hypothetical protein